MAVIRSGITLVATVYPLLEELFTPCFYGYDEYQCDTDDHDGLWLELDIHSLPFCLFTSIEINRGHTELLKELRETHNHSPSCITDSTTMIVFVHVL